MLEEFTEDPFKPLPASLVPAKNPNKQSARIPRCALRTKLPPKVRNSYVHVDNHRSYEDWLGTCRFKLDDEYCANPPPLEHSWPHTYRAVTRCRDKSVRNLQFDESVCVWVRAEDFQAGSKASEPEYPAMLACEQSPEYSARGILSFLDSVQDESFEPEPESLAFSPQ